MRTSVKIAGGIVATVVLFDVADRIRCKRINKKMLKIKETARARMMQHIQDGRYYGPDGIDLSKLDEDIAFEVIAARMEIENNTFQV